MTLSFISENPKKLAQYLELQKQLAVDDFTLVSKPTATEEIQSVNADEVMHAKIAEIRKTTNLPFIVDDVSLYIASSPYPGALVKHLLRNIDLATMPQFLPNGAAATVVCLLGYFDGFETKIFRGELAGHIRYDQSQADQKPGLEILIDVNGSWLGEVPLVDSYRGKAFQAFVTYLQETQTARKNHDTQVTERWSSRAEGWQAVREDATSYVNHENGYDRFDAEVKRILPLVSGAAIDIGCGDGAVTRLIGTNKEITTIEGLDISPEMARVATEKTTDARTHYQAGVFTDTGKRYGLITSRGVILSHMHRSQVVPTLEAMAASLLPNGYLVLDYISNLENHDDVGRMTKNQLHREWLNATLAELGLVNISYSGSDTHRVSTLVFHKPTDQSIYFATSNSTKVLELQSKCTSHILHLTNIDVAEIKNDDIIEIAKDKAKKSYALLRHPVIVTDGGIYISALKGFPGPNSKQAAMLLGPQKLLEMLTQETDRSATRRNCMVYYDGKDYNVCVAEVPLRMSDVVTESEFHAYPLDTILIPVHPENPNGLTHKQMPVEQRVQFTELPIFERFIATF